VVTAGLAFLRGRELPFDFLVILPRLVRASPLPMVVPPFGFIRKMKLKYVFGRGCPLDANITRH
jgi:hypothetical protein